MAARSLVVDAGFLVAFWKNGDQHHEWAVTAARANPPPWFTCEAVLSEAEHLLGPVGRTRLRTLCRRGAFQIMALLASDADAILDLLEQYRDIPMSIADACLVRLTEILPSPLVLTTDGDFKIYRRNTREAVPCLLP